MIKEKMTYKIGDRVKTTFKKEGSSKEIEVTGIIKEIVREFGKISYVISNGSVGEFKARKIYHE